MTDKSDSSLVRMLGVLDLFSEQQPTWTADAIASALQVSLPTGYRYVRLLSEAGYLQRTADSHYSLGPRIVVLDYLIRVGDPVLQHGIPFMKELVAQTGLDCVITGLYGNQMLDTHRESGNQPASLSYGRGRPRPMFLGAAPKVILASFAPAQLRRLFDHHAREIAAAGLPTDWTAFRKYYSAIRKAGSYFSNGELEPNLAALGVPLVHADGRILGAISLVSTVQRMAVIDLGKLAPLVVRAAQDITARVP
ncbi:IclR family transcriptional regulator [Ramlibacter sp. MAHUQ-53]|uniref:IclR family transcriptional regulator n=1 Tax=unclassified Ramlibacter TaxID=2617605 RepID=UPI00363CCA8C